jgi:hypothetical protein
MQGDMLLLLLLLLLLLHGSVCHAHVHARSKENTLGGGNSQKCVR